MESVFCIDIGVFVDVLTRGNQYLVLERDNEKEQIKIKGDNGRVRWYPTYCFAKTDASLFKLKDIHIDDKIENPYEGAIEVTIT